MKLCNYLTANCKGFWDPSENGSNNTTENSPVNRFQIFVPAAHGKGGTGLPLDTIPSDVDTATPTNTASSHSIIFGSPDTLGGSGPRFLEDSGIFGAPDSFGENANRFGGSDTRVVEDSGIFGVPEEFGHSSTALGKSVGNVQHDAGNMNSLRLVVFGARGLQKDEFPMHTFVKFKWKGKFLQTFVKTNTLEPEWDSKFDLDWAPQEEKVMRLDVWRTFAEGKATVIWGSVAIDVSELRSGTQSKGWYKLQNSEGEILIGLEPMKRKSQKKKKKFVDSDEEMKPIISKKKKSKKHESDDEKKSHKSHKKKHGSDDEKKSHKSHKKKHGSDDEKKSQKSHKKKHGSDDEKKSHKSHKKKHGSDDEKKSQKSHKKKHDSDDDDDQQAEPNRKLLDVPKNEMDSATSEESEMDDDAFDMFNLTNDTEDTADENLHPDIHQLKVQFPQCTVEQLTKAFDASGKDLNKATEALLKDVIGQTVQGDRNHFPGFHNFMPNNVRPICYSPLAPTPAVQVQHVQYGGHYKMSPMRPKLGKDQEGQVAQVKILFPHVPETRILQALQSSGWQNNHAVDNILEDQIATIAMSSMSQTLHLSAKPPAAQHANESFQIFHGRPHIKKPAVVPGLKPAEHTAPPTAVIADSGRRKALLIGINYIGTPNALRGCIEDVHRIKKTITTVYGFPDSPNYLTVLTDDHADRRLHPTKRVMLKAMEWLVKGAQKGDVLFFHFSGHGSQQVDQSGDEANGYDETILPSDFKRQGHITDDVLNEVLANRLMEGVKLTCVMDCCHSGTGMDLPYILDRHQGSWKTEANPKFCLGDVQMFSGSRDEETSADVVIPDYGSGGAMSLALISSLTQNPFGFTYRGLLNNIHAILTKRGFKQRPQLSSTQKFPMAQKFSFTSIHPNSNNEVGRKDQKKKKTNIPQYQAAWAQSTAPLPQQTRKKKDKKKKKKKKTHHWKNKHKNRGIGSANRGLAEDDATDDSSTETLLSWSSRSSDSSCAD